MGLGFGALKYFLATFLFPGPYYIFGGTLLWFWDVVAIIRADNLQDLALAAFGIYFDIPTSIDEFLVQHLIGGIAATALWFLGMAAHETRRR